MVRRHGRGEGRYVNDRAHLAIELEFGRVRRSIQTPTENSGTAKVGVRVELCMALNVITIEWMVKGRLWSRTLGFLLLTIRRGIRLSCTIYSCGNQRSQKCAVKSRGV